jgi:hypothetical protein
MLRKVEKKAMDESLLDGVEINKGILVERSKHNERIGKGSRMKKMLPWTNSAMPGI